MGSFNFNYADKTAIATKGFILIPTHAQEFFQTDKIKVTSYRDYGHFRVAKNKFVDLYVIQGIINAIANNQEIDVTLDEIYFDQYDYYSKLEKYRVQAIDETHDNYIYNFGKVSTKSKFPIKVVSSETLTYETTDKATISGQFTKYDVTGPVVIVK